MSLYLDYVPNPPHFRDYMRRKLDKLWIRHSNRKFRIDYQEFLAAEKVKETQPHSTSVPSDGSRKRSSVEETIAIAAELTRDEKLRYLSIFCALGDYYCDNVQNKKASKEERLLRRKEFIRRHFWKNSYYFEELYSNYIRCDDRFGGILIDKSGTKMLLIEANNSTPEEMIWTVPRGRRQWVDETDVEAARRHIKEELRVRLDAYRFEEQHAIRTQPQLASIKLYIVKNLELETPEPLVPTIPKKRGDAEPKNIAWVNADEFLEINVNTGNLVLRYGAKVDKLMKEALQSDDLLNCLKVPVEDSKRLDIMYKIEHSNNSDFLHKIFKKRVSNLELPKRHLIGGRLGQSSDDIPPRRSLYPDERHLECENVIYDCEEPEATTLERIAHKLRQPRRPDTGLLAPAEKMGRRRSQTQETRRYPYFDNKHRECDVQLYDTEVPTIARNVDFFTKIPKRTPPAPPEVYYREAPMIPAVTSSLIRTRFRIPKPGAPEK